MSLYRKTALWVATFLALVINAVPLLAKHAADTKDIEFLVVIPSFNNNKVEAEGKNWIEKNLESVFIQTNPNWTLCYVNNCSTDGTGEVAEQYAQKRGMLQKCRFINNPQNKGALANLYTVISECPEHTVVVLLDGDDELFDDKVLDVVANEYRHHKAWMTYGSFIVSPSGARGLCRHIPAKVMKKRLFRQYRFVTSHLRTFYAKLFQRIKKEDLMHDGKFFGGGWDLAILFPMLEMASKGHVRYIRKTLYKWNSSNPLSDCRQHSDEQGETNKLVRAQPPYPALKKLFSKERLFAKAKSHGKTSKPLFVKLMGDCKQGRHRPRHLRAKDRSFLKLFSRAYDKNMSFLKKEPLNHIPHQMHLIWIGPRPFPAESVDNVRSFRTHHPDWVMNFWTDNPDREPPIPGMVKRLVTNEYFLPVLDLYTRSTNYGEKSDLLRFVIMFNEGGLYFDHDATCLRSLERFADSFDYVSACERLQYHEGIDEYFAPAIGLFLCKPHHPILKKSWSLARERWDSAPHYSGKQAWKRVIYRTFDSFAKASILLHNTDGNRDLILPSSYFYANLVFKKPFVKKLQKAGYVYSVHDCKGAWR